MPAPGSNRGYLNSTVLNTFVLMKHEGGKCFDDIRILLQESELINLLGLSDMLTAKILATGCAVLAVVSHRCEPWVKSTSV